LNENDLSSEIKEAYGRDGLGVLLVSGVPKVKEYRDKLLKLSHEFSHFEEKIKNKYEDKMSYYSFGWSFGKEKFDGKYDTSKGSYYNNPQYDVPTEDKELISKYPALCSQNIWPKEDLPELEQSFKNMGKLIIGIGLLVSKQCDKYIKKINKKYEDNKMYLTIKESKNCKARLLYYFPKKEEEKDESKSEDDWCGWNLDHGTLTGLTCSMMVNEKGEECITNDKRPGLYIKNRKGETIKASWPTDTLHFKWENHVKFIQGVKLKIKYWRIISNSPLC